MDPGSGRMVMELGNWQLALYGNGQEKEGLHLTTPDRSIMKSNVEKGLRQETPQCDVYLGKISSFMWYTLDILPSWYWSRRGPWGPYLNK